MCARITRRSPRVWAENIGPQYKDISHTCLLLSAVALFEVSLFIYLFCYYCVTTSQCYRLLAVKFTSDHKKRYVFRHASNAAC